MDKEIQPPIVIPKEQLSGEALDNLVGEFILREGTDYGAQEVSYDTKVRQIHRQLEKEEVVIVFDPNEETVSIVVKKELKHLPST